MPTVRLGNLVALGVDGPQTTEVTIPENYDALQRISAITAPDGVWRNHSGAPEPAWVESSDPILEQALSAHYGCPIGESTAENGDTQ